MPEEIKKRKPKPPGTMKGPSTRHGGMFQPGQSGHPGGNRRLPEDVREAKQLSRHEFARAINKFFYLTKDQLLEKLQDPELSMVDLMVGSIVERAALDQDVVRAQFLLDRAIGRVQESIQVKHTYEDIPNDKLILMAQEAIQVLQQAEQNKPLALEAEFTDESTKDPTRS